MGRIFEVRKASMFARWDKMAKNFTRIGKEIAIAVKAGGPDPENNPALRRCFQNAKSVNMPKDRVEAAIKRAMGKDLVDYEEIVYEGVVDSSLSIKVTVEDHNDVNTATFLGRVAVDLSNFHDGKPKQQWYKLMNKKLEADGVDRGEIELKIHWIFNVKV